MTELWKKYKFKGVPSYALRIEVSNLGRVKSYSRVSNGELVTATAQSKDFLAIDSVPGANLDR